MKLERSENLSVEPSSIHYYGLAPNARFNVRLSLMALITLPLVLLLVGLLFGNRILMGVVAFVAMIAAPLCISLIRQLSSTRLGIDPSGVFLVGPLGRDEVHLPWKAIERLHLSPGQSGIVLREPLDNPVTLSLARANRVQFSDKPNADNVFGELAIQQRWVPFEAFSGWLEQGELLDEFRKFSPTLAANFEQAAPQLAASRKRRRRIYLACLWGVAIFFLIALIVFFISQIQFTSAGQSLTFTDVLAVLPSITFGLFILVMIPLLLYYAWVNSAAAIREFKNQDQGAALTCLGIAAVQAGFAIWIISSILLAKR